MYWTHSPKRSDLEGGHVFVHGIARLNLSPVDLATFVDPPDAALVFGLKGLDQDAKFETSVPVWMATLRRRSGDHAIVESLQRVFTQVADEESLFRVLSDLCNRARTLGYRKLWFVPALYSEPLYGHALKRLVEAAGRPIELVPSTGMSAMALF